MPHSTMTAQQACTHGNTTYNTMMTAHDLPCVVYTDWQSVTSFHGLTLSSNHPYDITPDERNGAAVAAGRSDNYASHHCKLLASADAHTGMHLPQPLQSIALQVGQPAHGLHGRLGTLANIVQKPQLSSSACPTRKAFDC
eukprot:GHRR01004173.1.p2 GENE.GHRR01004173.1~~GHRR01004173.1.p2  ORF type:complete len:140 (-),score=21.04 GHRR01004173.1:1090-1509(-)